MPEDIDNPSTPQKRIIAKSTAFYRGVCVLETQEAFVIFLGFKQYTFVDLREATAFIDAWYAQIRLN